MVRHNITCSCKMYTQYINSVAGPDMFNKCVEQDVAHSVLTRPTTATSASPSCLAPASGRRPFYILRAISMQCRFGAL